MTDGGTATVPPLQRSGVPGRGALAIAVIVSLLLAAAVLIATSDGLAMGQRDAPSYLSSAENLAAGLGYRTPYGDPGKPVDFEQTTSPVVDFPPGYPATLSVGVAMGVDSETMARVLNAMLVFGVTLSTYLIARARPGFRSSRFGAVLVGLIAGTLTLPYTTTVLTEPLYGLLLLLTLAAASTYVSTKRMLPLILATLLAAVATAVRTSGLALVGTVMIVSWLALRESRRRWLVPLVIGLIGVAPFYLSTSVGNRTIAWHPPPLGSLKAAINAVAEWFVPPIGNPTVTTVLFALLLIGLLAWVHPWNRRLTPIDAEAPFPPLWSVGLIAAGTQVVLLLVTDVLLSAQLNLGSRQLYPAGLSLLFAVIEYLGSRSAEQADPTVRHGFVVLGVACLVATGWTAVIALDAVASGMRAFNSTEFLESEPVEYVVGSVPGELVFGNVPDGLWVAGLSDTRPIPTAYDPLSLADNELMEDEMARLAGLLESGAVVFYQQGVRDYMVDESQLRAIAPCEVVEDGSYLVLAGVDHAACSGG